MASRFGRQQLVIEAELDTLQRQSFSYLLHEVSPVNGLVTAKTAPEWPASIAATGFAEGRLSERGLAQDATGLLRISSKEK